jgi:hypothetical protein
MNTFSLVCFLIMMLSSPILMGKVIRTVPNLPVSLSLVKTRKGRHSYISLLSDENGRLFILKQKKSEKSATPEQVWRRIVNGAIRDVFGSYVAYQMHVSSQYVWIIPPSCYYPGKHYKNMPATLHTVVPGKSLRDVKKLDKFSIELGHLGLTLDVIAGMSLHNDLPLIVGLDTFIGNYDRTKKNLFYHKKSSSFWTIDTDRALKCNLMQASYQNLLSYESSGYVFSSTWLMGLQIYKQFLSDIRDWLPLDDLLNLLRQSVSMCQVEGVVTDEARLLKQCQARLTDSYSYLDKLIYILDEILQRSPEGKNILNTFIIQRFKERVGKG